MGRLRIFKGQEFEGYPIQQKPNGNYSEILRAIVGNMEYMWITCHRRVLIAHFSIGIHGGPMYEESDSLLWKTLHEFKRKVENRRKKSKNTNLEFIWCRELGEKKQDVCHYHMFTIADGRKFMSADGLCRFLNKLLKAKAGERFTASYHPPKNNSYAKGMIVSPKNNNLCDAIHWMSYLAKVETKAAPAYKKRFGYSKGYLKAENLTIPQEEKQEAKERFERQQVLWVSKNCYRQDLDIRKLLGFDPADLSA